MNKSNTKNIMITGAAGFIGSELCLKLIGQGFQVIGIDNHNDYYDPNLKENRLNRYIDNSSYTHYRINIEDSIELDRIFKNHDISYVAHLAAQAGVRYSMEYPKKFINTNVVGFLNLLEACKNNNIKHLIFASSSSVYGLNQKIPFSTNHNVDHPASIYAATKKSNELLAHTYSHLYKLPTTGLRFFTVYGPWNRPDMALQSFTESILEKKPIKLYNCGKHRRDFTYIDDIIEGISKVVEQPATANPEWDSSNPDPSSSSAPYRIYNIGNNNMVELEKYIDLLEKALGVKAKREMLPLQPGDMIDTYANVSNLIRDFNYQPKTPIEEGIPKFIEWYLSYYKP